MLKKSAIIAKYTFLDIFNSKIIYNVLLLGIGLIIICFIASEFTYGVVDRVALDFGLGTLSISTIGIAIFLGVSLISKEIEQRTLYMMLSRPISRFSFLIGKLAGMSLILALNMAILTIMTLSVYLFAGGDLNFVIFAAILFIYFESLLILLVVVFFSLITNSILSIIYSIALLIGGHLVSETTVFRFTQDHPVIYYILKIYTWIFPHFSKLNFKNYVIYNQSLPLSVYLYPLLYVLIYGLFLIALIGFIFNNKELD